jgi:tellurium resistance protein TerD
VVHAGDNLTGAGEGDDENIRVDLQKVPAEVEKVVVAVTIHEAAARNQNFGQVSNAFMRVVNDSNAQEIARYDLSEDASTETAMIFGEIYRNGADWKFRAVGQGFAGGLAPLASSYGVAI